MNNNFIKNIDKELQSTLCIDFDGVIHDHNLGFHDGTIYGEPIKGSLEALKELSLKYKIIIFTCKARPDRPLINGKTGAELVWEWLDKHNVQQFVSKVTATKPIASAYIDDKAIRFENWEQCVKAI
jgi:hypothetical protein